MTRFGSVADVKPAHRSLSGKTRTVKVLVFLIRQLGSVRKTGKKGWGRIIEEGDEKVVGGVENRQSLGSVSGESLGITARNRLAGSGGNELYLEKVCPMRFSI